MSYDEYSKIQHETPYFYIFRSGGRLTYYFGSNHSHDPNHPQFNLLRKKWNEFTSETRAVKTVVIVEAHEIAKLEATMEESIIKHGESGAGAYLAYEFESLLIFGEPHNDKIIAHLLRNFSKEEILLWHVCQAIKFWQQHKMGRSIQEFLSNQTQKYRRLLNWPDLVISVELINTIYKKLFNRELNIDNEKTLSEITTPVSIQSRINELSRSQSIYRNEYVLGQIEKYWSEGYNIFVIYGAGHAVMQEPAIRSLVS
ncbi:MAG: hypothetical protein A3C63_00510 [Candidatus Zambryskibacteria bacterium RIFCSPHIGHO2_02_FULL_39_82]|nr:MAG: hypothetical protein UT81_C0003G0035 [Parcubacteria group bacterium GW2011_GWA2_40_14]OHA93948.1 MAG: hypothetical protein A2W58_01050 [Candidatus Zambryskibacteria bacterium RIFCSPHIGHO2_02_38_10.5]OHA95512.1 MAG: hypothetical protein A3C63_00510 [Candidatus Zambryskibacteria bacterium RIFCSPHIGHO2_02_FULL_39_82]